MARVRCRRDPVPRERLALADRPAHHLARSYARGTHTRTALSTLHADTYGSLADVRQARASRQLDQFEFDAHTVQCTRIRIRSIHCSPITNGAALVQFCTSASVTQRLAAHARLICCSLDALLMQSAGINHSRIDADADADAILALSACVQNFVGSQAHKEGSPTGSCRLLRSL